MRFWDTSAIVPLCLEQPTSAAARALLKKDANIATWWASRVECWSTFARLRREKLLDLSGEEAARSVLRTLHESWTEIHPGEDVRMQAARLLRLHPLRAHDALQLAAALTWAGHPPSGELVVFDRRLQEAARLEGLTPIP